MKIHYLTFVLIGLLSLNSCGGDDDGTITPPNPTSADISGSVNLYDEGTTQIDNSNMSVKVEGTSKTASTNAEGEYTLTSVSFGTYTLSYEKAGYGTFKKFGVEHKDGNTIITQAPSLGEVSTTQVTNLAANVNGNEVVVSVTTDPAGSNGNTRYVRYFLSTDANVSSQNYSYHSEGLISRINPLEITLSEADLTNAGFASGETVYIKVYGDSFWSNEYDDPGLSRKVFPNLNMTSADAVSFEVP